MPNRRHFGDEMKQLYNVWQNNFQSISLTQFSSYLFYEMLDELLSLKIFFAYCFTSKPTPPPNLLLPKNVCNSRGFLIRVSFSIYVSALDAKLGDTQCEITGMLHKREKCLGGFLLQNASSNLGPISQSCSNTKYQHSIPKYYAYQINVTCQNTISHLQPVAGILPSAEQKQF